MICTPPEGREVSAYPHISTLCSVQRKCNGMAHLQYDLFQPSQVQAPYPRKVVGYLLLLLAVNHVTAYLDSFSLRVISMLRVKKLRVWGLGFLV